MTQHHFSNPYFTLIQAAFLSAIINAIAIFNLYLRKGGQSASKMRRRHRLQKMRITQL